MPLNSTDNKDESLEFLKRFSIIEQKAYRDTWGRGLDSYLQWFYDSVVLLGENSGGSCFAPIFHAGRCTLCDRQYESEPLKLLQILGDIRLFASLRPKSLCYVVEIR